MLHLCQLTSERNAAKGFLQARPQKQLFFVQKMRSMNLVIVGVICFGCGLLKKG